jgi:hypothetical protein
MTRDQGNALQPGLYILHWTSGGSSFAAVGQNHYGDTWYAPTNWVMVPSYYWRDVERVESIGSAAFDVIVAHERNMAGAGKLADAPSVREKREARAG